jgi:cell volume regulation protein A
MTVSLAILLVGLLIFSAHLFAKLFDHARIPDVLPLMAVGLLIGPIFHMVSPKSLGRIGDLFSMTALVIILFQGGLELQIAHLKSSLGPGIKLSLLNFIGSVAVFSSLARFGLHWPWIEAALLGSIGAATSSAVVIPLSRKLRMEPHSRAMIVLESAFSDVLCIVITIALLEAAHAGNVDILDIASHIVKDFTVAVLLGSVMAVVWASILKRIRTLDNSSLLTPAMVCVVFGMTQLLGFSGAIAALAFGIILGNIVPLLKLIPEGWLSIEPLELDGIELSFINEIAFLIKTLFFVYIGFCIPITNSAALSIGFVLAMVALGIRIAAVKGAITNHFPTRDRRMAAVMTPKGLAAAVLATMAVTSGLPNGPDLQSLIYSLILFSILATAVLAFFLENGRLRWPYTRVFPDDPEPTVKPLVLVQ